MGLPDRMCAGIGHRGVFLAQGGARVRTECRLSQ